MVDVTKCKDQRFYWIKAIDPDSDDGDVMFMPARWVKESNGFFSTDLMSSVKPDDVIALYGEAVPSRRSGVYRVRFGRTWWAVVYDGKVWRQSISGDPQVSEEFDEIGEYLGPLKPKEVE